MNKVDLVFALLEPAFLSFLREGNHGSDTNNDGNVTSLVKEENNVIGAY